MKRSSLAWLSLLATALVAVHALIASRSGTDADDLIVNFMWAEVPIYLAAVVVVLRDNGDDCAAVRRAVAAILVIAAILRGIVLPIDPVSTDINRYIWDGRVQAAGINPYRYIPKDPALNKLRDDDIYPEINRKDYARTIYPPFAQIVFFLVSRIDESITNMKAAMVAFDAIAIWALIQLLDARNIPRTRILLYAWHPVPIWEFAGDGHVDAIAVACICLALLAAQRERPFLAGVALGCAALAKFFPIVIGPALYRRWDWKLPLAGLATVVLLYLPYLSAGKYVFGFLSGYSAEEGFRDGSGVYFWLLAKAIFPALPQGGMSLYMPAVAVTLGALGLGRLFRPIGSGVDLLGAFLIATVFTVLTSPHYIWYVAWLVPFLCFMPWLSVLWLTCAATFMNNIGWPNLVSGGSVIFLPLLALAALDYVIHVVGTREVRKIALDRACAVNHAEVDEAHDA